MNARQKRNDAKLAALRVQMDEVQATAVEAVKTARSLAGELDQARAEAEKMRVELASYRKAEAAAQLQLDATKSALSDEIDRRQAERTKLHAEAKVLRGVIASLLDQLAPSSAKSAWAEPTDRMRAAIYTTANRQNRWAVRHVDASDIATALGDYAESAVTP